MRWSVAFLLIASFVAPAQDVLKKYWKSRFDAEDIAQGEVEGLDQRIAAGKLHLQLREFLGLVLKNFTDIQITRLDVYTAADQIVSAKNPFDPSLNLSFNAVRSVSPLINAIAGSPSGGSIALPETLNSLSQTSIIDYKQLLPTGETFESTFTGFRSSGDGYSYPTLFGVLNFQFTQPLLQNRTALQYLTPLRVARTQLLITSKESEAAIATAVAQAATQYWNAILARENIRVDQQALDLAQQSYRHDKLALDLGAISKLDIFQSQTQVAERGRDLVSAQYQYKVQLDGLRRLIGADLTPKLRETEIVLDDDPSLLPDRANILSFEQALAKAMQARPEVTAASAAVNVDNMNARASRDALLPRLDLSLQGGSSGPGFNQLTAGSVVGLTAAAPPPGLGSTLQQVLDFSYPTYGFSLSAQFPFHNSTAKANLADALVNRTRDRYRQRQIQEQITLDVRQATHSIELADVTIDAAIRARDLARQNVDAEQQKYQLGSIAAFELLDAQSRLANTESALVTAYVDFQEAYISYQRATWTLLDGFGMIVDRPQVR
ncbi:MAG: TolC family protein [Acidobacteriaceae bacterium]|nr:TolC family protein [Acidobacteriaceae bacterium]